jgi:hypothetical protein
VQRCEDGGHSSPEDAAAVQREEAPEAEEGAEEKMAQTYVQREEEAEEEVS